MEKSSLNSLEPKMLWHHFTEINAIPRGSKKEGQIIQFMIDFGEKLGLETFADPTGNVIIRKPATPGMENRKAIVMQSHLDMVHQKNNDVDFDFDKEGINMYVDGDWVKAKGTTLGADNGIGVAAIMAVLSSDAVEHPALEALFTIDEETGMTGAQGLEPGRLNGEILLNLDTEEDDEIDIGCAGGIDVTLSKDYQEEALVQDDYSGFTIEVKGLKGGHSGMDIDKGLGNANIIMNRLLISIEKYGHLARINGGGLRNAIPRESNAVVACKTNEVSKLQDEFESRCRLIKAEFNTVEPGLDCLMTPTAVPEKVLNPMAQKAILGSIDKAINGVYKMSAEIEDLVETSNNIARVKVDKGQMEILCLTRSSVEEGKMEVANALKEVFENQGFSAEFSGSYPGWTPNKDSSILKVLSDLYEKMFNSRPSVVACHAGLECGLLGTHYPGMDMISFGPTIKGAHSPDERASISSVLRFWNFLQEILKNIPVKN